MRYLLDTHVFLWWMSGNERLALSARQIIASPDTDVLVSVATLWEILVKVRAGGLDADLLEIERVIATDGFTLLGITIPHLKVLATLPAHHRDPFDHLIIAQAISEDATLISDERMMPRYPVRLLRRGIAVGTT